MASAVQSSKVLVVCDSPVLSEVLQLMLLEHSEEILLEEDRTNGGALIAAKPDVDVVILDANLRRGDAFALLEDVVRGFDPRPRVVMITGSASEARRARESGADDFLTRPITFIDVARVLRQENGRVMQRRAPRRRSDAPVWALDEGDHADPAGDEFPPFLWNVMNISSTGAFILTESPLPVGMVLDLALDLDGQKILLKARVVRVQDPSWGNRGGVGVAFLEPEASARGVLEAYVSQPETGSQERRPMPAEKARLRAGRSNRDERSMAVACEAEVHLELQSRIDKLNAEKREIADRLRKIEREGADLANLYLASCQLNSASGPTEVLEAVLGILTNLIGAQVFCVYALDEHGEVLLPIASEGEQTSAFPEVPVRTGLLVEAVERARISACDAHASAGSASEGPEPLVCIPMRSGGRPVGVIAIYRLFEQKAGFSEIDQEILALLAGKAATAVVASRLLAQAKRNLP